MDIYYILPMLLPKKSKKSKKEQNFYCVCCDFSTSKKSNYDRHLTTQKHLKKSFKSLRSGGKLYAFGGSSFVRGPKIF